MKQKPIKLRFSAGFQLKYVSAVSVLFIGATASLYLMMDEALAGSYLESLRTLYYLEQNLPVYLATMALLLLLFVMILTLVITLLVSHQIAGPVYRYEQVLKQMIVGVFPSSVATRQGDQLKPIVGSLNQLSARCRGVFEQSGKVAEQVESLLSAAEQDDRQLRRNIDSLRDQLGQFEYRKGAE